MSDVFSSHQSGLDSPASDAFAITAGASALAKTTRSIFCGGAGTVTVNMASGATGIVFTVAAGQILPIRATHVTAATATDLVGLV